MCLLIEALRALVPSGTKLESSTIVRVCASDENASAAKISGAAKDVFDYLVECGGSARRDEIGSDLEIADISRPISDVYKRQGISRVRSGLNGSVQSALK